MLFSSVSFLYAFLPLTLLIYLAVPRRWRNAVLLVASLAFYFLGEPRYTALLLISSASDYAHSLIIEKHRGTRGAKIALVSSIIVNVAMLGFFKYADFIISILNTLPGVSITPWNLPLPLGISFFTFQTMSYTIDVYRGRVHAQRNPVTMATFVCLFPQLIAGPIVRYSDVEAELRERRCTLDGIAYGIRRLVLGLGKKVLLANTLGEFCKIFRASDEKTVLFYWAYALAYTLQIYFDFSGYSDMAIGLGKILGFSFPENFDHPFASRSITEFWRRWHMTLGGWFRDYVYIPLGGNRVSRAKWLRNIAAVWLLTGLWHGAEWNFVVWGGMFGVLLACEKLLWGRALERAGAVVQHIYTMLIVMISFVIFGGTGLSGALSDIGGMFGLNGVAMANADTLYYIRSYAIPFALAIIGSLPLLQSGFNRLDEKSGAFRKITVLAEPLALAALLLAVTASLVNGSFNPFLYFRF